MQPIRGAREARTRRDDDDGQKDNDADAQPDAHLHILIKLSAPSLSSGSGTAAHFPPHLLADLVRTAPEVVRRLGQLARLVLQVVQALAAVHDLVNVITHNVDSAIDLLLQVSVRSPATPNDNPGTVEVQAACWFDPSSRQPRALASSTGILFSSIPGQPVAERAGERASPSSPWVAMDGYRLSTIPRWYRPVRSADVAKFGRCGEALCS